MLKSDVLQHFQTASDVARAIEITPAAVCKWGPVVPMFSALEIERVTEGAVKVRHDLYVRGKPLPAVPDNYAA